MRRRRVIAVLGVGLWLAVGLVGAEPGAPVWPEGFAKERRALLERALAFLKANPEVPYKLGSADATGMDCSGAIYFLFKEAGVELPRSAHGQYEWMKREGRLTEVPASARKEDDPVFAKLEPGDLVFYAHDGPDAPAELRVSHVHLYLGKEADGHAIMIGSSEGRSYRGKKVNGFGITDYHVPAAGSKTRMVAYGIPKMEGGGAGK
jgi:cell wall-associated NlpC family hydrolase